MRLIILILLTASISTLASCSWFSRGSGNCLDDNSCEGDQNALNVRNTSKTWHCYGKTRGEPWNCLENRDDDLIVAVSDKAPPPRPGSIQTDLGTDPAQPRAEISFEDERLSSTDEPITREISAETPTEPPKEKKNAIFSFPPTHYAIQLIALQSVDGILSFATNHNIDSPRYVRILSQGSDWYVLLLGIYADLTTARQSADDWNQAESPESKPWVRPLGPLQEAARNVQATGES